MWFSY